MNPAGRLAGNGVELIRERALAARVQGGLERLYELEHLADVGDFVHGAQDGERETLYIRCGSEGDLELSLGVPRLGDRMDLDGLCQIIEGVSHFVYVVERARAGRTTTQLELELQAEVDKWVVLAASISDIDQARSARLRSRLYEQVAFSHQPESVRGERYRIANETANHFVRGLERQFLTRARLDDLRTKLRRFYRVGQEGKLRLGQASLRA